MEIITTIDIGTTAVRIVAFDYLGNKIAYKKGSYPTFHPQPDYSEQDPEQVFITVLFILKSFLNELQSSKKYKVKGLVFSSSMHSVLSVDKKGTPLGNAMIWADNRAKNIAEEIKYSEFGNEIYHNTGTPIHAMSPLSKITWLKQNDFALFEKTHKFISLKEYVFKQFTGEYMIDYSLASATGIFNIRKLQWDPVAMEMAGIRPNQLSEAFTIFNADAKLKPELAKTLNIPSQTKIILGSSDGCMATIGTGVFAEGHATVTITSSGAVRVLTKEIIEDSHKRLFNYILDNNYYITGGPTNNGGVVFDWVTKQFGDFKNGIDFDEVMHKLFNEALHVPAGAEGLLFLPYLLGERAPIWNSNARGCYFGININHESKHFCRATIEGIAFELLSIGKVLEKYKKIDKLSLTGTISTLPLWGNLVSDIFGKKVNLSQNTNNTNLGSALVGLTGMGVFTDLKEAAKIIKPETEFEPNFNNHEIYSKYYRIFSQLTQKLTEEFKLISELQV